MSDERVLVLLEKIARRIDSQGFEANLNVDGQKMANVSQKYMGMKSYGDR